MKCMNCGKEFKSVRATAKYCSDKCRADYLRKNGDLANLSAKAIDSLSARNLSARNLSAREQDVTLSGQLPANFGLADCQCLHCRQLKLNGINGKLNHGSYMPASELKSNGYILNRVTLSGDIDYRGAISNAIRS